MAFDDELFADVDPEFLASLPEPDFDPNASTLGEIGRGALQGVVPGLLGLGESAYAGLAGLTDLGLETKRRIGTELDSPFGRFVGSLPDEPLTKASDFLKEQMFTARNLRDDYNEYFKLDQIDPLSARGLTQSAVSGALEFAPALANPLLGAGYVGATTGARRFYDLPLQAEQGEAPTMEERFKAAGTTGALNALGAGLPAPWITKAYDGPIMRRALDFLGRTAKTAGVNAPVNAAQTALELAQNRDYAGQDIGNEQLFDASLTAAKQGAAMAVPFTMLGALGSRRPSPVSDLDARIEAELNFPETKLIEAPPPYTPNFILAGSSDPATYSPSTVMRGGEFRPVPIEDVPAVDLGVAADKSPVETIQALRQQSGARLLNNPFLGVTDPLFATRSGGLITEGSLPILESSPEGVSQLIEPGLASSPRETTTFTTAAGRLEELRRLYGVPEAPGSFMNIAPATREQVAQPRRALPEPTFLTGEKGNFIMPLGTSSLLEDVQGTIKVKPSSSLKKKEQIKLAAKKAAESGKPVVIEGTAETPTQVVADEDAAAKLDEWALDRGFLVDPNRQLVDSADRPPVGSRVWGSTSSIAARPELMQFRRSEKIDAETGASENRRLKPEDKWDSVKAGSVLVWEPNNPKQYGLAPNEKYIVVNGHNRLASAKDKNIDRMQIEIVREADGWSPTDVVAYGAEVNIAQGDANPIDITRFFRNYADGNGVEAAIERGRAIGAKGKKHLAVALEAQAPLYDQLINEKITFDQAYAVVREAGADANLQQAAVEFLLQNPNADGFEIASKISADKVVNEQIAGEQGSLIADPIPEKFRKQAYYNVLQRRRSSLTEDIQARSSAKQASKANATGKIQVTDVEGALNEMTQLQREKAALKRWNEDPTIAASIRKEGDAEARKLYKESQRQQSLSGMEQSSSMLTKDQPQSPLSSFDYHASDVGGRVVFRDGDIGLVRGHSILSGQPVYLAVKGDRRSSVDIESFTGPLISSEEKSRLIAAKRQIEMVDAQKHQANPFIKFDADGMAVSQSVDPRIAGIAKGWKELLGLKKNIYFTTIDDARANIDNFTGPHRAISSAALNSSEQGSMRKMGDDFYVAFTPGTSKTKMLEIVAHELGHLHQREAFDKADFNTKQAIRSEHDKFLAAKKGKSAREFVESLRGRATGRGVDLAEGMQSEKLSSYWRSFDEWYADQVSKWAVSSERPVSVVEQFFSRLGQAMRRFYATLRGQKFLPTETMKEFLDKTSKPRESRLSSERGAIEPGLQEDLATLIQKAGDNISELWGSIRGFKGEGTLPPIERELSGEGLRVFPQDIQGAARTSVIFPRTLAEKDADFEPVYRSVSATQHFESALSKVGAEKLKTYFALPQESRTKLDKVLVSLRKQGFEAKKQGRKLQELSDEALGRIGLSPDEIVAYRDIRKFTDWSLDLTRQTLLRYTDMLPKADRAEAQVDVEMWIADRRNSFYVPFVRPRGKWSVKVEDEVGGTQYYSVHPTQAEALRRAKEVGKDARVEQLNSARSPEMQGLPLDIQLAVGGFLDGVREKPSLKGFRARLASAKLVEGFNEDLSPGLADYALSISKWAALTHGAPEVFGAIAKIPAAKKNLTNYATRYWTDYKKGANRRASNILRFFNVWNLAGVPASGLVNLTQNLTTTLPLLSSKRWGGKAKDAPGILLQAAKDAADHYVLGADKFAAKSAAHAEKAAALREGIESGDLDAQAMGELAQRRSGKTGRASLYDVLMTTFTATEAANRRVAFLSGFELAKKQGLPFKEAVKFGQEFVLSTQFDMSDANRPQLFRSGLGRVLSQYKPFAGHMIRFLRNAVEQKDYKTLALSLGSQLALGGVRGLPFAAVTMGLIDAAFGVSTIEEMRKVTKDKDYADTIIYGLPTQAGINMATASGIGDVVPSLDKDRLNAVLTAFVGPIGQVPKKILKTKEALDKDAPWNAAATALPRFLRGPLRATEFLTTGKVSDPEGDALISKSGDSLRDAYTAATMAIGFPTTDYINEYERRALEAKKIQDARDNDNINLRYAKALRDGDNEAMQAIMAESQESMKGPPDQWNMIDMDSVKQYLMPRDVRTMQKAPKRIRPEIAELRQLFSGQDVGQ